MPAERMFFTAVDGSGNVVIDKQVRRGPDGEPGHGQRTFNPHTIRRWSPWMRCDRCHLVEDTHENQELVNITVGLGSDRYPETDGNGQIWYLDRIINEDYEAQVLVGHEEPKLSGPLSREVVERMMAVEVPALDCPTPGDVAVPFELIQDNVLTPSCTQSQCHNSLDAAGGLDLSPGLAREAMVDQPSFARPARTLVVPGDPDSSYLIAKLVEAGDREGVRMPQSAPPLAKCQIDMIRGWISSGAK